MLRSIETSKYDLIWIGAHSSYSRISFKMGGRLTKECGFRAKHYSVPDNTLWNFLSRYPFLFKIYFRRDILRFRRIIKRSLMGSEKVMVLIHKRSVIEPMMLLTSEIIKELNVDLSNIRILLIHLEKIPDLELLNACERHGVPSSIISDTSKDASSKKLSEVKRFFLS